MLGQVDKAVLRGGLRMRPAPVWFADNPKAGRAGPALVSMEAEPGWRRLPAVLRSLL